VEKAIAFNRVDAEVFVIDNHSQDSSLDYLRPIFSCVKFISNDHNVGFAKACNQGWQLSKGKYVLFLNPDTIVPEDCFSKCIFRRSSPLCGRPMLWRIKSHSVFTHRGRVPIFRAWLTQGGWAKKKRQLMLALGNCVCLI